MYSFARSIVSIILKLSHSLAVGYWDKKRRESYPDEQPNEANVGQPFVDTESFRENIRIATKMLAISYTQHFETSLRHIPVQKREQNDVNNHQVQCKGDDDWLCAEKKRPEEGPR